ncbi:MAG: pimeloyl-ACP methyl ester carboxylesterase [Arenicella sp.]|jgi:pimeloyl-ACP methyl ester carboxylesterase
MWSPLIPSLIKDGFQCILIDLPCHGESRYQGDKCGMLQMAQTLEAFLKDKNLSPEFYVGHSMGGYVSLELNQLRPAKIILLHSNFWEDNAQKQIDRNRVIEVVEKNKSLFIKEAIPNLFAPSNKSSCMTSIQELIDEALEIPTKEIQAATAGMRDRNSFYKFSKSQSLHIIHGKHDPIISGDKLRKEISKLNIKHELIELENVGHMSIWEDTGLLIKSLKHIISR